MHPLFKIVNHSKESSSGGEGDDFHAGTGFHESVRVISRENGLFVEFDGDGFAGKTEIEQEGVERERAGNRARLSVEGDGGGVHFHWRSCSGNGQSWQLEKSSRQKS